MAQSGSQPQPQRLAYRRSLHRTIWSDVRASSPHASNLIVGAVVGSQIEPVRASQGTPRKAPRAVKIRSTSVPEHPRAPRSCPRSVSGASWGVPGAPRGTKRVPEVAPGHQKERLGASGSAPRRRKWRLRHTRDEKRRASGARLAREASSERCSLEFSRFCMFLPSLQTL